MKKYILACALIIIFPVYSAHLTDNIDLQGKEQSVVSLFFEKISQYFESKVFLQKELPASFESEFKEIIAAFKKEGQDINGDYEYQTPYTWFGGTPLTIALNVALSHNLIQELIKAGADVKKKDSCGNTPLMVAVYESLFRDQKDIIKTLLKNGASPNLCTAQEPLLHVCPLKIKKLLLKHGANVNARNCFDKKTALHVVVKYYPGCSSLNLLLKHHPDVNAKDNNGRTPLHYLIYAIPNYDPNAAHASNILRAMKSLISAGADLCEKNNNGQSCIALLKEHSIGAPFIPELATWMQEEKKQKPSFIAFMHRALNGKLIWSFTDKDKTVHTTPPPALPLEIIEHVFKHTHYSWNLTDHIKEFEKEQIAFEAFADFRALLEKQ